MNSNHLNEAILRTLLYGDVFSFPMTAREIHHFLIGASASLSQVEKALQSPGLAEKLKVGELNGQACYAVRLENSTTSFERRQQTELVSVKLWPKARRYGILLGHLPFVRMVALTGALSMRNAPDPNDDLDYMLVVKSGRVWLSRLFAVMLVRLCKLWGVVICPNYVLADSALDQNKHNLFVAHEVTQMIPLTGNGLYQQMREANPWADAWLPNADHPYYPEQDYSPRRFGRWLQRIGEMLLSGPIGDRLEKWEQHRKLQKFQPQAQQSVDSVLDAQRVKGHFLDYGQRTMQRYHERLASLGLTPETKENTQHDWSSAAD